MQAQKTLGEVIEDTITHKSREEKFEIIDILKDVERKTGMCLVNGKVSKISFFMQPEPGWGKPGKRASLPRAA